ncbi:beta-propeller fold lactonase family protein [Pectobacterium brasiliense]
MTFSRSKSGSGLTRTPRQAWVLEPRMMFDAAAVVTAVDVAATVAATDTAPGVDATPVKATVTITDSSDSFQPVDLFSDVRVSADKDGQTLKDLVITVNRTGANQALVIDGTEITLESGNGAKTTVGAGQYSYTVAVSGATTTVTVSIASSEAFEPNDVAKLIDGIAYKPLDNTVAGGDVVVTLKSLSDEGDTADLDIHSTVTIDSKINVAPVVSASNAPELAELIIVPGMASPQDVRYSSTGDYAYAIGSDGTLGVFTVGEYGKLTLNQTLSGISALKDVKEVVLSADNRSLYAISGNSNIVALSLDSNGQVVRLSGSDESPVYTQVIASQNGNITGLAISSDGAQVYIATQWNGMVTFTRDATTGGLTLLQRVSDSGIERSGIVASSGNYVATIGMGAKHTLSIFQRGEDGTLTSVATLETVGKGYSAVDYQLAISKDQQFIYIADPGSGEISVYQLRDGTDGKTLVHTDTKTLAGVNAIYFNANGSQLYALSGEGELQIYSVDVSTGGLKESGQITNIGDTRGMVLSPDGQSLLIAGETIQRFSALRTYLYGSDLLFADHIALSDSNLDVLNGGAGNYNGAVVTIGREAPSADDRFGFSADNNLVLQDGKILQLGTEIGTFTQNQGVLSVTFTADVTKETANAVLKQITYRNVGSQSSAETVVLTVTASDGELNSTVTTVALLLTVNSAPTLVSQGGSNLTLDTRGTSVTLFKDTVVNTGEAGQALTKLSIGIDGLKNPYQEYLTVDGTVIDLSKDSAGTTVSGYQYTYTYNALSGESSLVLSRAQGISSMAMMKLVDGLSYSTSKESTSASGLRTITLTELQDNGGTANGGSDTATLTVSGSVNLALNDVPTIEVTYSPDATLFYNAGTLSGYNERVSAISVSQDGKTLLVTGSEGNNNGGKTYLRVYARDAETGELTLLQSFTQGEQDDPSTPAIEVNGLNTITTLVQSKDGSSVYVAGGSGSAYSLVQFSRDATTGQLSYVGIVATQGVNGVSGLDAAISEIVLSDDGTSLYAINGVTPVDGATTKNAVVFFSRDTTSGALTFVGSLVGSDTIPLKSPSGIVLSSDGKSAYISNLGNNSITVLSRDVETSSLSYVTTINKSTIAADANSAEIPQNDRYLDGLQDIVISPDNRFVYVSSNSQGTVSVFSRDTDSGELTYAGTLNLYSAGHIPANALALRELVISEDGSALYVAVFGSKLLLVLSRDSDSGALTYRNSVELSVNTVNHLAVSADGKNIYAGVSTFFAGLNVLTAAANAPYSQTADMPFATSVTLSDPELDAADDYKGATITVSRNGEASTNDHFAFQNGGDLTLSGSEIQYQRATIATFNVSEGAVTIVFTESVTKAVANQVLHQVTYRNGDDTVGSSIPLKVTFSDGAKDTSLLLTLVPAVPPTEPTVSAEIQQPIVDVALDGSPAAVRLFDDVYIALGKDGAALSELTLTVNRTGADQALVIDGSTIPLTATGAAGVTVHGHQYQVSIENNTTTITLVLHDGDNAPSAVAALIDDIQYQALEDAVAEGEVVVTLTRLVDANDNAAQLDISTAVVVLDSRLIVHLGAEAGSLDYAEIFEALDDDGNSRFTGIQGITVSGDNIYVVRTHTDSIYHDETETSEDVTYNTLSVLQRGEDGKLYLSDSVEITGLTDATQVRASSDGSSLYVIGVESIAIINASDLSVIGTFGRDIGMVRDVLINDDQVYITTGESLLVFTRDGNTLTLSKTFTDDDSSGLQLDAANALALSPDGKSLFVATSGSDTLVSRFSIGDDGTLTFRQAVSGASPSEDGFYASALSVSPDGKTLYVVDNHKSIHLLTVADDGALSATSSLSLPDGVNTVKQVLTSPDGKSVVITGDLGQSDNFATYGIILYARAADGSLTQLQAVDGFGDLANFNGTLLNEIRQVAFSADGKQLYITGTIDYGSPEGVIVLDLKPASITFTENSSPVALLPGGTLSAPVNDQGSYQGASIAIERVGGSEMGDQFGVSSDSGLSLKDNQVWQGDEAIADVTTASNGTLTITFLTGINQAEAQQTLRAITYHSTSNDPTKAGDKATFRITFNDGQSHTAEFTTAVALVDLNNAAVVSTESVNSTYASGSEPVNLFKNTSINTIESGQNIHRVELTFSPVSAGDVLHVDGGEIALDKTIDYQVFVGKDSMEYRVSVANGVATVTLYVARDGASAAQLIDTLTYSHKGNDGIGNRTVGMTVYEDVDWKHPEPQNVKAEFSEKAIITFQGSETPENSAPVYNDNAGLNLGQLQAGTAYRYTLPENLFTDADSDSLTWRVSGLPDGVEFDATTRTLSGTPTTSGEFTVVFTADDGKAEATHNVKVTVDQASDVEPENSAPVYNDNAGLNLGQLKAGTEYRYTLPENLFTDADSDSLTWRVSRLPDGLSFDAATRTLSGTPTTSGEFTVVFTADDGKAEATHTVKVTVDQALDVEPQPEIPDNTTTAAPVILVQQGVSLPVDSSERERDQPLGAIVADLSRPEAQPLPTNIVAEPVRQRDADTARQSDAPWVLDPVMSSLMPTLEQVNFSSRAEASTRDNAALRPADSNLFLSVRGQTTALESAFSSVQGALQPDASGALAFSLPQRMFSVREGNATLTLQLANGRPLPAWVQFDARNGVVRITDASAVQVNQIQLALKAQATDGSSRIVPITLQTGQGDGAEMATDRGAMQLPVHSDALPTENRDAERLAPAGKTAFTEQLRQYQPEQDALLAALSELSSLRT